MNQYNEKVVKAFEKAGIKIKLLLFEPNSTKTSQDAAMKLNCNVAQICKSIAVMSGDSPMIILTSGKNRVDFKKIKAFTGKNVRLMKPAEVKDVLGFEIGGVPPFGHDVPVLTLMDADLFEYDIIYAAGGTADSIIPISPKLLREITKAHVMDVKK